MARLSLDEFEIGPTLGVGSVGTIYQVRHKSSHQDYALKLLLPAVSSEEQIVRRFKREMMVLSKLDHPNIVRYVGSGQHDGQLFYVMERIQGDTLKQLLKQGGVFSWREAAECGRQIASALQHAHNHGIIHRDLKTGNVFLTNEGHIKLGDFGIARDLRATDLTDVGLLVGTYAYMAPELVRGQRAITGQVDLYALGCLLFEMMTGRTPFVGDNFAEILEQHLHSIPPTLRDFGVEHPPELEELIAHLLAKAPHDRPFNARSVQGRLGELCETSSPPESDASGADRGASDVHSIQASLIKRIEAAGQSHDVSWRTVALLGLGLLACIGAAVAISAQ